MSGPPQRVDVVVIGAGPAGSTAANLLAQRGFDVAVLDKALHPRITVGESMIPHFWKYTDQLGATKDIEKAGFIQKSGGTAVWRGVIRQLALADFGFTRAPLHVERGEFDQILLDVARRQGARVFEQTMVRQVILDGDRAVGVRYVSTESGDEGEIRCAYVVDASGQGAVIANQLGFRDFDRDLRFLSIWGYFEDSDYVAQQGLVCPWRMRREVRPTTVQAGIGEWGWGWHIVQKEATSVGLVLAPSQQAAFKASGATLEDRFRKACLEVPVVGDLLRDARLIPGSLYAIRDFAYRPSQLAGDGWYVAGDAAAFVDPINSAGVLTAFYTGSFAAVSVVESLKDPRRSAYRANLYETLVRQRLALFRISALPQGHNSYPEDYAVAVLGARLDSASEQELLVAQTILTDRPQNLEPLLAIDGRLRYRTSERVRHVSELTPIAEAPSVA